MATVLGTCAWNCGNPTCPDGGWHRRTFRHYVERDEFTVDDYSDGKEEEVDERDVPARVAMDASWLAYSLHVARTGSDPLHAFPVPRTQQAEERWDVCLRPAATGKVELVGTRKTGSKAAWRDEPPTHVLDALGVIAGTGTLRASWTQLQLEHPTLKAGQWHPVTLCVRCDRDQEQVRSELMTAAAEAILANKTTPA
jgi:hypothetical protein